MARSTVHYADSETNNILKKLGAEKRDRLVFVGRAEDAMMDGEFDDHAATTIADTAWYSRCACVRFDLERL
jgi:hypothetical protein